MSNKTKQNIRKVTGTAARPRVAVFKSNRQISAQLVDDSKGLTLAVLSSAKIGDKKKPTERAFALGAELAKIAKGKKMSQLVYDRRRYRYHGQVKALAEGLREGGIKI